MKLIKDTDEVSTEGHYNTVLEVWGVGLLEVVGREVYINACCSLVWWSRAIYKKRTIELTDVFLVLDSIALSSIGSDAFLVLDYRLPPGGIMCP